MPPILLFHKSRITYFFNLLVKVSQSTLRLVFRLFIASDSYLTAHNQPNGLDIIGSSIAASDAKAYMMVVDTLYFNLQSRSPTRKSCRECSGIFRWQNMSGLITHCHFYLELNFLLISFKIFTKLSKIEDLCTLVASKSIQKLECFWVKICSSCNFIFDTFQLSCS